MKQVLRLTREQRSELVRGECPRITFPADKPRPLPVGYVKVITPHVKLEVTGYRKAADGEHVLVYTLHNNRLGQRYLAKHGDEHGYSHTGGSDVDSEAGEAIDEFTQRRFTAEARIRDQAALGELLSAMEDVRAALDERVKANPDAAKVIGRELWQLRGRIDAAKARLKRRMAA